MAQKYTPAHDGSRIYIRLEGKVTPERLAAALGEAEKKCRAILAHHNASAAQQDRFEFDGFYGATLYLNAYSPEGEKIAFQFELNLEVGEGVVRPALTGAAQRRARERSAAAREKEVSEKRAANEAASRLQARAEAEARGRQEWVMSWEAFFLAAQALVTPAFVDELNAAVTAGWPEEFRTHHNDKTLPTPPHQFHLVNGRLCIRSGTTGRSFPVRSPVGDAISRRRFAPTFTYAPDRRGEAARTLAARFTLSKLPPAESERFARLVNPPASAR